MYDSYFLFTFIVYMIYSIPLFSYELIRQYSLGNIRLLYVLNISSKSLIVAGPIYAAFMAFFNYTSKEKYWLELERRRNKHRSLKEMMDKQKPANRINLEDKPRNKF